jgi:hypothetical protein
MVFFAGATEIGRYSDAGAWTLGPSGGSGANHNVYTSNTWFRTDGATSSERSGANFQFTSGPSGRLADLWLDPNGANAAGGDYVVFRATQTSSLEIYVGNNLPFSINSSGAVTLGPSTLAKHTVNGRFKLSLYTDSGAGPFNNYSLGNYGVVAFTNGGAVILTGITGGADGDVIYILCGAGTLRLDHNSGSSGAGNKLFNKTGANITLAANAGVTAVYASGGWFIIYGP